MKEINYIETNEEYEISDKYSREMINKLNTKYESLNTEVELISNKKYVLLSDSYGLPEGSGGLPWITQLVNSQRYTINKTLAINGGGFGSRTYPFSTNWETQLSNDNSVTDVIILAGANDGALLYEGNTTENEIKNGIGNAFNVLKTKYPNAKIHLGFIGRHHYIHKTFKKACDLYAQYCGINGGLFINNCQYILHSYQWIDDTDIHPTQEGSNRIYRYISTYMNGGSIDVEYTIDQLMTGTLFGLRMHVNNGITTIQMYNHYSNDVSSVPISLTNYVLGNDYYNLIKNFIFWDFTPEDIIAITVGSYYNRASTGETNYNATFMIGFKYNVVTGTGMGNDNEVATDVNKITLGLGCLSFDSMLC